MNFHKAGLIIMATSTQINAITALYVGYFDRAPDPAGLQFWIDQLDNGREYNTIAADFAASPEAVALYPYLTTPDVSSPASFVTSIYANLFGRTPDQEGLDFWTGVLEDGSVSVADMIEAIIMGARDDAAAGTFDKSVLDNKVEVGLDFATSAAEVPGFEFDAAAKAAAVAAVNGVTEDEATVEAAKEATDAFVSGDSNPGTGDYLTLTDAIGESVVGTAGNDTFTGVVDGGTGGTMQFGDQIDGGAGRDTLNLFGTANADGVPAGVDISNVEVVNIHNGALGTTTPSSGPTTVDDIDAADFGAEAEEIWQVEAAGNISGLTQGQAAGFRGANINMPGASSGVGAGTGVGVSYAATATAATIALDGIENTRFEVSGAKLETLTIAGSTNSDTGAETIVLSTASADLPKLETLNVSVENDIVLDLSGSSEYFGLKTVDASGSTGGITTDLPNVAGSTVPANALEVETLTGGSGDDSVTVELELLGADDVTMDFGAGDDTLNLDASVNNGTALSITLGEGDDTVSINGGETSTPGTFASSEVNNVADVDATAKTFDGLISIVDFNVDDDVLDFTEVAYGSTPVSAVRVSLTNPEQGSIGSGEDDVLFDAIVDAEAFTSAAGETVLFEFDSNTYAFVSDGNSGFDSGDGLIELAGVSLADIDTGNFVI
ncbi:DUF4214 domain-containing protein [Sulfitobacter sp. KE37]|uniref:DUF4214 domain-containing protein n=1 Tax=unclassified Sulfitobacter TaxID=196795 RepID=UPI0023E273EE|nr:MULTISPECIES: DUF4214 domain-containing protein [unclassified Sulfitobacter]MDF3377631.1 DUF4214 domain-containing protein [Sulfitobacter sp. KE37]MDF3351994.1 DUF4214 domain-containing protein [Sulfitobacter sp. KE12]MDF3355665.1 DUF4214 domain-containing protein [Sulfitobacter sp. KE27]MDF3370346.1 DUF4214 domain-containing protein [Sulfitobacter sp. Ks43]MDF3438779.1 DUF4214 domain-containing protein [Sulfitobacter sp. Ks46]